MEISGSYTNTVSQVTKTNQVSSYANTELKADYSKYTASEIRDIPYEEAKMNSKDIIKRLENLDTKNVSQPVDMENVAARFQIAYAQSNGNEKLDKAMYGMMQSVSADDVLPLSLELSINLQDYAAGKDIHAGFVKGDGYEELHSNQALSQQQLKNINVDDFLSKMLETFTKDYNEAKGSVKEQYKTVVSAYELLKENYESNLKEPFYA
jgi:hypothetical protein